MAEETEPTFFQKIAPIVVAALLVATVGSGVNTWHIAVSNAEHIAHLKNELEGLNDFMIQGPRCTAKDCELIRQDLKEVEKHLREHDSAEAHREASKRMKRLEELIKLLHPEHFQQLNIPKPRTPFSTWENRLP